MPGLSVGFTSVAFFYLAILLYNSKAVFESIWTANYYAAFEHQLASPVSWFIVILVSGIVVMVEMCLQMWRPEAPTATELLVAYEHGLGPKHPNGRNMKLHLRSEAQKDDDDDDDDDEFPDDDDSDHESKTTRTGSDDSINHSADSLGERSLSAGSIHSGTSRSSARRRWGRVRVDITAKKLRSLERNMDQNQIATMGLKSLA